MFHINYIDHFETTALDVLSHLSAEAERADITLGFLTFCSLRPEETARVEGAAT